MFRSSVRHLIGFFPMLILAAPAAAAPPTFGMDHLCRAGAETAAKAADLPAGLLTAISLRETGRWSANLKTSLTWPWTVTARGRGYYLDSKADAIAFVKRLQKRGVSNIDVGCMQINLHYHSEAFANLQDAFDPRRNASYAADFLARLRASHGGLAPAVARYHSSDQVRGARYRTGVFDLWLKQPKTINHQAIATAQRAVKKAASDRRRIAERAAQKKRWQANRLALAARKAAATAARAQRSTEEAARRTAFAKYRAAYLERWRAQRAGKGAS